MAYSVIKGVAVRGLVSVVPANQHDNLDVSPELLPARERLVRNIGIRYRRICSEGMIFSDLAERAARELMRGVGWTDADLLVLVTQSPEYPIPASAIILQDRLGLSAGTLAFDINLGCSGFPYGVFTGASMLRGSGLRRAIVIVGDQSASKGAADEGREVLFSDAAAAIALEFDESAPDISFLGASDGSGYKAIYVPHGGKRHPMEHDSLDPQVCADGIVRKHCDVWLDGPAIVNFSTQRAPEQIHELSERASFALVDVDYFFFHQANRLINETIRKKLRLEPENVPVTLHDFGNTSSASIPVTMSARTHEALAGGKVRSILSGFGVGLSWATMLLETDSIYAPPLIELQ